MVWNRTLDANYLSAYQRTVRLLKKHLAGGDHTGTISFTTDIATLPAVSTLEVLAEDLLLKKNMLAALPYSTEGVDIYTNTSSYAPSEISANAIGLHFFNPIHMLRFAEISNESKCLSADSNLLFAALRNNGFELIHTAGNRGHIGNQILFHEIATALRLIDYYGYQPETIDAVLAHLGRSTSLFNMIDLVGIDTVRSILLNLQQVDPSLYLSPLLDIALKQNILGRKNRTTIRSVLPFSS